MNKKQLSKEPVSTEPDSGESLSPLGHSRRKLLKSGGKAAYVAPTLLLLNPINSFAQVGGTPPCDPNKATCLLGGPEAARKMKRRHN